MSGVGQAWRGRRARAQGPWPRATWPVAFLAAALAGSCRAEPDTGPLGRVAWIRGDSLYTQAVPSGAARLAAVAAHMHQPRWSPSGQWLALATDSVLRLVRADGSGGQKLSEATTFAWAPRDDRIAFVAGGNLVVARAGGLGVVLFEKTASTAVTSLAWSPDGAWIASATIPATAAARPAPPPATSLPRLLLLPARGGQAQGLALPAVPLAGPLLLRGWTGDGAAVVVAIPTQSARAGAPNRSGLAVYAIPARAVIAGHDSAVTRGADPAAPALLSDSVLPYTDFVAPAPHGAAVALVAGAGLATWRDKALVLASGGKSSRLSAPGRAAISPAWSADGGRLAWADMPDADLPADADARIPLQSRRIVVAGLGGAGGVGAHPLGGEPGRQEAPRWVLDGRHLLYVRVDSTGRASLRLGAEGEPERAIVPLLDLPAPAATAVGEYGYLPWADAFDYWGGALRAGGAIP